LEGDDDNEENSQTKVRRIWWVAKWLPGEEKDNTANPEKPAEAREAVLDELLADVSRGLL